MRLKIESVIFVILKHNKSDVACGEGNYVPISIVEKIAKDCRV